MTDFAAILETETDPIAPIRSSLLKRFAKNCLAMFEGAAGAPRLLPAALQAVTAGTVVRSRLDAASQVAVPYKFGFGQSGVVRVSAEHRQTIGGTPAVMVIRRWRAGIYTDLISWSASSSVFVARSADVSVLPGDTLEIGQSASNGQSEVRNCRIQTSGEFLFPFGQYSAVE